MQENAIENVIWKMAAILSGPQRVKYLQAAISAFPLDTPIWKVWGLTLSI